MDTYKVALIHNIISPYRIPLFNNLYNHPLIDLSIYFCKKTHKIRKWDVPEKNDFKHEVLPGYTIEFKSFIYHINPSIIFKLINGKYDAVIIGGNPDFTSHISFFICKLFKIPTIWWSGSVESPHSFLGTVVNPLTKYIVQQSDTVVVPGLMSKEFHVKLGANPNKIFIAPNVLDNDFIMSRCAEFKRNKSQLKKDLGFGNKKIILYVGRLDELKGIDYLLFAYKKLKNDFNNISLVIVGDGPFEENLKKTCIDENIDDVHFTGWLSDEKIMYYSISDIFVLPTLKDVWGQVVNEAMCCGLPIITTEAAGCSKDMIISAENGYIVEPSNAEQLYLSMKNIISNNDCLRMGKKSLEIIENKFTIDKMVNNFVSAIEYSLKLK